MKKIIAFSEPSRWIGDISTMVENHYNCTPLKISQNKPDDLKLILDLVKQSGGGVILAGGDDICPVTLGIQIQNGECLTKFDIQRDRRELFTIKYCFENEIPIFGICRGFQILLGAYYNLGLIQDISGFTIMHSPSSLKSLNEEKGEYLHWINFVTDSLKTEYKKTCNAWVTSYHHQAVYFNRPFWNQGKYYDKGIEIVGIADLNLESSKKDKVDIIELARGTHNPWIACQFHPEAYADYKINHLSNKVVNEFGFMMNIEPKYYELETV